jgi:hypothetical protein
LLISGPLIPSWRRRIQGRAGEEVVFVALRLAGGIEMFISATVGAIGYIYIAKLSDGRIVEEPDLRGLATALNSAGVLSQELTFDWRAGQRMMTAGQQVALHASMRGMEHRHTLKSLPVTMLYLAQ